MTDDKRGSRVRGAILALVSGAALALTGGAPMVAATPEAGDADSEIRRLEDEWRRAQKANDTAAFETLLSPDLTFIGTSGTLRDRADFIASRADSKLPRADSYEYSELRVRVFGDTAVVTGREATTGAGVAFQGRFTHVWVRQAGAWRLVAVQRTDVADAKSGSLGAHRSARSASSSRIPRAGVKGSHDGGSRAFRGDRARRS